MRWMFCIAVLALLLGCSAKKIDLARADSQPQASGPTLLPPQGQWIKVKKGNFTTHYTTMGTFYPFQETRLGPQVSGRVAEVLVEVGDGVKENAPLVKVDPVFFDLDIRQRKSALALISAQIQVAKERVTTAKTQEKLAQIAWEEAKLAYTRMKNLWKQPKKEGPSIPKSRYDRASFQFQRAQGSLELARQMVSEARLMVDQFQSQKLQAQVALDRAYQRKKEGVIRAPFAGVISKKMVHPGSPISSAPVTYVLQIQQINPLRLIFSLPQKYFKLVQAEKTEIFFRQPSNTRWQKATLDRIEPQLEKTTRSLICRSLVQNPAVNRAYLPGMMVQVRVPLVRLTNQITVPSAVLQPADGGWKIWVKRGSKIFLQAVKVGLRQGNLSQITKGIQLGDEILLVR